MGSILKEKAVHISDVITQLMVIQNGMRETDMYKGFSSYDLIFGDSDHYFDALPEGPYEDVADWVGFYDNGEKHFEYPVKNRSFNGLCHYWDKNGVLRVEEYYLDGWLNGCRRIYDGQGHLCLQESYGRFGTKEGIQVVFDESGRIKARTLYVSGHPVDNWLHRVINIRKLCTRDILRISDDETRRVCIDEMGYDNFLNQVEYKVIAGERESVLIRVNLPGVKKYHFFLRTYSFERDRWYLFRAPHDAKTVRQAFAWALERYGGPRAWCLLNCLPIFD